MSAEWNNIDLVFDDHVLYHDVSKRPLPYDGNTFHAVYTSHLLEHLTQRQGLALMKEAFRVLKNTGVCRVVVPDLEQICRMYLHWLERAIADQTTENVQRYQWMTLEMFDQIVREKPGGLTAEVLRGGQIDRDFARERIGDELRDLIDRAGRDQPEPLRQRGSTFKRIFYRKHSIRRVLRTVRSILNIDMDPRKSGEAHKWMYDRLSLKLLLEEAGFRGFSQMTFRESRIHYWERFALDRSSFGDSPRKPDSLYVECEKRSSDH